MVPSKLEARQLQLFQEHLPRDGDRRLWQLELLQWKRSLRAHHVPVLQRLLCFIADYGVGSCRRRVLYGGVHEPSDSVLSGPGQLILQPVDLLEEHPAWDCLWHRQHACGLLRYGGWNCSRKRASQLPGRECNDPVLQHGPGGQCKGATHEPRTYSCTTCNTFPNIVLRVSNIRPILDNVRTVQPLLPYQRDQRKL